MMAVLHTWTRTLEYHPHVHLLVSAGGLSPDATAWIKPAYPRFLAPGYVLSPIFDAKVRDALREANLYGEADSRVWTTNWCVHVQQIGTGQQAALYLSRYVYRVALTNPRIERFENGEVTFRYRHARTRQTQRRTLPVQQLIALFLQHVLPRGFTKICYYGLLSPSSRQDLEHARHLLVLRAAQPSPGSASSALDTVDSATQSGDSSPVCDSLTSKTPRLCPACGKGHLILKEILPRSRAPVVDVLGAREVRIVERFSFTRAAATVPVDQQQQGEEPLLMPWRAEKLKYRLQRQYSRGVNQSPELRNADSEEAVALAVLARASLEEPLEDCGSFRVAERLELTSKIGQIGYRTHGFAAMSSRACV
ncbi:MAG: hypothetical protein GEU90_22020 [Gemmatimonas sp.]|nr:hypothetical protein [Gemmatimonas sp.]